MCVVCIVCVVCVLCVVCSVYVVCSVCVVCGLCSVCGVCSVRDVCSVCSEFMYWESVKYFCLILSISATLSHLDKRNACRYNSNAMEAIRKIYQEVEKIMKEVKELKNQKYLVAQDA